MAGKEIPLKAAWHGSAGKEKSVLNHAVTASDRNGALRQSISIFTALWTIIASFCLELKEAIIVIKSYVVVEAFHFIPAVRLALNASSTAVPLNFQ